MDYEELLIYQQKKIIRKLKLNFNQEKEKSKKNDKRKQFHKLFRNELDILIHQFYRDGIQFYGFTMDLLFIEILDPDFWSKIHTHVESWVSNLARDVELVEFVYISIELNQQKIKTKNKKESSLIASKNVVGVPQLHGVIGVRTILGQNDYLDIQIRKVFRSYADHDYITIDRLKEIKEIKNFWDFVIKENNFKFHRFARYGESLKYIDIYGHIADMELIYDEPERYAFGLCQHPTSVTRNISGVKVMNPDSKTIIIYLLNLFLWHKSYKINKNNIYVMIPGSFYSWEVIDTLEALKKNNITVFECLKQVYPQQLEEINTIEIINHKWNSTMDDIILNNQYLSYLDFKSDAVEFKDGIFFLKENKFFSFEKNKNTIDGIMRNKNCCVYFDKNFYSLKKPKKWLKTIINTEDFCINLAKYFQSKPLECLFERSLIMIACNNTGKINYVANVIRNLLGKEKLDIDMIFEKEDIKNFSSKSKIAIFSSLQKSKEKNYEYCKKINQYFWFLGKNLKKELPSIIIYCNRLFFKKKKLKKKSTGISEKLKVKLFF